MRRRDRPVPADGPIESGSVTRRRPSGEPPPLPRELDKATIGWLAAFGGWVLIWIWVFMSDAPGRWITERDLQLMAPIIDHRSPALDRVAEPLNHAVSHWATAVIGWTAIAVSLVARRIRHVVLLLVVLAVTAGIATTVGALIERPRPLGVEITGDWSGYSQPSRPFALVTCATVAAVLMLTPVGRWRSRAVVAAAIALLAMAWAQLYVGVDHPTDVIVGATMAVALTLAAFRVFAPESVFPIVYRRGRTAHLDIAGARGDAIVGALERQLGVRCVGLEPVGLAGSAGSTPIRAAMDDGSEVFAKLYAQSHLRADRFYKLGRTLRYGRLEDEHRFTSVRRIVEHEDYILHVMDRAGIRAPEPLGVVELTPEREYLLVTEFLSGAVEIGDATVTPALVDQGLILIRALWDAGLAHRDIKPSNLMVRNGDLRLIDVAFAQIRPSPWRQAVDLANMMLVLALGSSPALVHQRARRHFTDDEIAEAFAATRGITIPGQLRAALRADRRDVLRRFEDLVEPGPPVRIQRWSVRRLGVTAGVTFGALVVTLGLLEHLPQIGMRP